MLNQGNPPAWTINARTLIAFRWAAVVSQSITIAIATLVLDIELWLWPLGTIIAAEIAINIGATVILKRGIGSDAWLVGGMLLDLAALTALLMVTGGPLNPFSSLYVVHIALAALILKPSWTWTLGVVSMVCFASLFLVYPTGSDSTHAHHDAHDMSLHLRGMWVALAVTAAVITLFVGRLARQLAAAREQVYRGEKITALATLAAGAAHELSTPLSTIAILAKDVERDAARSSLPGLEQDAQVIREQVARCRVILEHLAADAGTPRGEEPVERTVEALVDSALAPLAQTDRLEIAYEGDSAGCLALVPERTFGHALRALVKNAVQATAQAGSVSLRIRAAGRTLRCEVDDDGVGMTDEVRRQALDPFYTTRAGHGGMGLGLFLAVSVAELLGGELTLEAGKPRGTRAVLELPLRGTHV